MKFLPKIVFLLIWFINLINPTPAFSTPESPNKSNLTESTTASSFTHPELETSPEGREFLGCYERVSRAYFLLSAGKIGFGVFKNSVNLMKSSWTKFKTSNFFANYKTLNPTNATKLESEVKNVIEEADKLDGVVVQGAGNIFEVSIFKNLTARIPTGSKLTNLKKAEFVTHGYKVKPTSGGLKTQIDDIIANGDNLGAKTEGIVDDIMSGNGYTKMDGKYGSNNGYDGIYIKGTASNPTEIVIIESKQFKYTNGVADDVLEHSGITLNPPSGTTQLPTQMSDGWINYVAGKLKNNPNTSVLGNKVDRDFAFKLS
jgi:hypothetical protein